MPLLTSLLSQMMFVAPVAVSTALSPAQSVRSCPASIENCSSRTLVWSQAEHPLASKPVNVYVWLMLGVNELPLATFGDQV